MDPAVVQTLNQGGGQVVARAEVKGNPANAGINAAG